MLTPGHVQFVFSWLSTNKCSWAQRWGFILGLPVFPGQSAPLEALTSSFVVVVCAVQTQVVLTGSPSCSSKCLQKTKSSEPPSATETAFPILEKAQPKNSRSYFLQKYCEITNTIPLSSLNRVSGFTLLKAHKSRYGQSHIFKAPIQYPHAFITIYTVDQDKQMRLLPEEAFFFPDT